MTQILLILDESQSMTDIQQGIIDSVNSFIKSQKELKEDSGSETTFTFLKFNQDVYTILSNVDLNSVRDLTKETYSPSGRTALFDAMGWGLLELNVNLNEKVIVVIVTDGQDNSSVIFDKKEIFDLVSRRKQQGWNFFYLSSDIDTFKQGEDLGLLSSSATTLNIQVKKEQIPLIICQTCSNNIKQFRSFKTN